MSAVAVGVAATALFAWTACRTVYFGDSGELIAAAHSLGVAHPPGYPLYTLLGHVVLGLRLGEPAWSMNLLSALCGGICCGAVARLTEDFTRSRASGAAAGLGLMAAPAFWSAATVAEVYTLHLALLALLLCCAAMVGRSLDSGDRTRALLAGAVLLGLGLSHRPTIVLALPAAWVVMRAASRARGAGRVAGVGWPWMLSGALTAVLIPVLFYGTLILRARAQPALDWGHTVDLTRLVAHVTTRGYRHYAVGPEAWFWARSWFDLGRLLASALGPVGIVFSVLGLSGLAGVPGSQRRSVYRWVPAVLGVPVLAFGLSYATPDVEVLFLPLLVALFLALGIGVADLSDRLAGKVPWFGTLAVAAVVVPLVWQHYPTHDLHRITAARDYADDMLNSVPAGGILFVEGDDAFLLAYETLVLGRRSDVTIYDRKGILFRDEIAGPGPEPRNGETGQAYRIRREIALVEREFRNPDPTPVVFMSWPGYPLPPGLRFEPEGLFYRVRRDAEPWVDTDATWAGYHEERILEQARGSSEPQALTVAATYPLMRGERALFEGDSQSALAYFDRAGSLAGDSESIHNYLGTVFGRLADYERAVREFERAIEALPVSVRAWNNLALARSLSGDTEAAKAAWERSLELSPDQVEVRRQIELRSGD